MAAYEDFIEFSKYLTVDGKPYPEMSEKVFNTLMSGNGVLIKRRTVSEDNWYFYGLQESIRKLNEGKSIGILSPSYPKERIESIKKHIDIDVVQDKNVYTITKAKNKKFINMKPIKEILKGFEMPKLNLTDQQLVPERQEGESYEDYKARRKEANNAIKNRKEKGVMVVKGKLNRAAMQAEALKAKSEKQ